MAGILTGLWQGLRGLRPAPSVTWASAGAVFVTIVANFTISRYESAEPPL